MARPDPVHPARLSVPLGLNPRSGPCHLLLPSGPCRRTGLPVPFLRHNPSGPDPLSARYLRFDPSVQLAPVVRLVQEPVRPGSCCTRLQIGLAKAHSSVAMPSF